MPVWLSKMVLARHLELQPRHAGLAQQNGFGTAFRTTAYLQRLAKGAAKPNTCS
jgi:hypothetical protein